MRINLLDIINKRVPVIEFEYLFMPDDKNTDILLPENIEILSPLKIGGRIIDKNEFMDLEADVFIKYKTKCDRCLEDIYREESYDISAMITLGKKNSMLSFEDDEAGDNIIKASDSSVDITDYVMEELSLLLPVYNLCSDNCMGLCQKCGAKLSDGGCSCETEKEIDPRLLIFKKLLENQD